MHPVTSRSSVYSRDECVSGDAYLRCRWGEVIAVARQPGVERKMRCIEWPGLQRRRYIQIRPAHVVRMRLLLSGSSFGLPDRLTARTWPYQLWPMSSSVTYLPPFPQSIECAMSEYARVYRSHRHVINHFGEESFQSLSLVLTTKPWIPI